MLLLVGATSSSQLSVVAFTTTTTTAKVKHSNTNLQNHYLADFTSTNVKEDQDLRDFFAMWFNLPHLCIRFTEKHEDLLLSSTKRHTCGSGERRQQTGRCADDALVLELRPKALRADQEIHLTGSTEPYCFHSGQRPSPRHQDKPPPPTRNILMGICPRLSLLRYDLNHQIIDILFEREAVVWSGFWLVLR